MTRLEAEEFIQTVISPGDVMDVNEVRRKYRDRTLQEALEEYEFGMAIKLTTQMMR